MGDLVLLYTPVVKPGASKKLFQFNRGPYRIVQQTSAVNFKITHTQNANDEWLVYVDRLIGIPEIIIFPALYEEEENNGLQKDTQSSHGNTDLGTSQLEEVGNLVEHDGYQVFDLVNHSGTSNINGNTDTTTLTSQLNTGSGIKSSEQCGVATSFASLFTNITCGPEICMVL